MTAADPMALFSAGAEAWAKGLETWGKMIGLDPESKEGAKDRRFAAPEWHGNPVFDTIRKTYLALVRQAAWYDRRSRRASTTTTARRCGSLSAASSTR